MRRMMFLVIVGFAGTAVLLALGFWQLQRLDWKESVIAEIEQRIAAEPEPLPEAPTPERDIYAPVFVEGRFDGAPLRVLTSERGTGPGYRIIQAFVTDEGRRILVDRGFLPEAAELPPDTGHVRVVGNLHWPRETDSFTPEPDTTRNIWFARDVEEMARALGTEPVLVVQRDPLPGVSAPQPRPVDTAAIPNDHLQYALTWFGLAVVWVAMTGLFLLRGRRQARGVTT